MDWMQVKTVISEFAGLSRDALHLLTGFSLHLILALVLRSWIGAWVPLALVALAAGANEWFDLTSEIWSGGERGRQWYESGKDMALTLIFPLALVLMSRLLPRLMVQRAKAGAAGSERPSGE